MLGIFDSGLGGLTVVRAIEKRSPRTGFVYLGDTARLPYGTKSPAAIERYAFDAMRFLKRHGVTQPVIACHTVSSVLATRPSLQKKISALFGGRPVIDVVSPAIDLARHATKNGKIGILGTNATIRSGVYQRALRGFRVVLVPAPVLVSLAEEGWGSRPETKAILRRILDPFRRAKIDTLVLSCTHFPLLQRQIRDILGSRVRIIDPGEEVARIVSALGKETKSRGKRFFVTDIPADFSDRATRFLGRTIQAKAVELQ